MPETTRRDLLQVGTTVMAGAVLTPAVQAGMEFHSPQVHGSQANFGHTMLFMDEYYEGTLKILGRLRTEIEHVAELSARAADAIQRGRTVWTSMDTGHLPLHEHKANRRGNPGILKNHQNFEPLQKGDMVFTNDCKRSVLDARQRGVYVVCVTTNYQENEFRPVGFTDSTHSNPDGLLLKDVSNDILHSHVPYQQGLVHAPEIPEMAVCPSSGTGMGALFWMINAAIAEKLAEPDAAATKQSTAYLDALTYRVQQTGKDRGRIFEVAVEMALRILGGGRWFVESREFAGFSSELLSVASGPRITNWGDWDASQQQNVLLVNAISPAFADEVRLAQEKRAEGALVIGIGPAILDGVRPAVRLIDVADFGFDNHSPESGGVISYSGAQGGICPTSGVVGNVIQQMICAQWLDEMVRRGAVPYFYMGGYQEGGAEYNSAMRLFFERQGF